MPSASSTRKQRDYRAEYIAATSTPEGLEKKRAYRRSWRARNYEKNKTDLARWKAANPEKRREYIRAASIKNRYGLTRQQYQAMFDAQDHRCAICNIEQSKLTRKLCVDHDHQTKVVRSLICHHCNGVLGHARDRADVLRNAISYLERHRA